MANMKLLEQLCTLRGISGDEESVRDFIVAQITPYAEHVIIDAMGNVIAEKKGAKPAKTKLMLNAHMDEVGLIVTHIDNDGYLKFATVGGIDKRVLCGRSVIIGNLKSIIFFPYICHVQRFATLGEHAERLRISSVG